MPGLLSALYPPLCWDSSGPYLGLALHIGLVGYVVYNPGPVAKLPTESTPPPWQWDSAELFCKLKAPLGIAVNVSHDYGPVSELPMKDSALKYPVCKSHEEGSMKNAVRPKCC